jgi:hypothetical protein
MRAEMLAGLSTRDRASWPRMLHDSESRSRPQPGSRIQSAVYRGTLHLIRLNCTQENVCYKQHACTAVQSVLAYLPHRPMVFSATTLEFSQRTKDSAVTVDNRATLWKILSSVICFRFIRSGELAIALGLLLSSLSSQNYICR